MIIDVANMRSGYLHIIKTVLDHGDRVSPRGIDTIELIAPQIVLHDVRDALPVGIGRRLNVRFAAAEAIQLIGGFSDVELTIRTNPNMKQFVEDAGFLHGAYGPRIGQAMRDAVRRLQQDKDTRQAIVTIWNNEKDLPSTYRDLPCTVSLQFLIRNNRLRLITTMRSNDVWWGLAYDAFQFTQLQLTVANILGIEPGVYVHQPASLHVYTKDIPAIMKLEEPRERLHVQYPQGFTGKTMHEVQECARRIAGDSSYEPQNETEQWYREHLL